MSEFFDAREYTTDAGDDSDLDSTEDEDIDEEDDEEEDEFLEDDNETIKRGNSVLETSSSRDDSDIVPVCNQLDSRVGRCLRYNLCLSNWLLIRYAITIQILVEKFLSFL